MSFRENIVQEYVEQARRLLKEAHKVLRSSSGWREVEDCIENLENAIKVLDNAQKTSHLEIDQLDRILNGLQPHLDDFRTASPVQSAEGEIGDSLESSKYVCRKKVAKAIQVLEELKDDLHGIPVEEE